MPEFAPDGALLGTPVGPHRVQSENGVTYVLATDPSAPEEPPIGRGGKSYYLDGEDPRQGQGRPDPRGKWGS